MSRLFDFCKGLIGLAVVLALLAGVPALLLVIVGFPLPTEMPQLEVVRAHIADGDVPDEFVVKTLALVVWLVWVQLAVAVLTELLAVIRGRTAGRAPVLPAVQLFARKLVATMVLLVSAFTTSRSGPAAPIVPIEATEMAALETAPAVPVLTYAQGGESLSFAPLPDEPGSATAAGQYETKPADNWWDLAERLLGDGMRWSELRDLNKGRTMLTGETITDRTETVAPGWRLDVPSDADPRLLAARDEPGPAADAPLPADEVEAAPTGAIESDAGAEVEPGAGAEVEPGAGIENGVVPVGDRAAPRSSPLIEAIRPYTLVYEGPSGVVDDGPGVPYQVEAGDNLWDIAERHLGDPYRWPEIYERSDQLQQPFGLTITDPNLIWPDSILWLPSDAVDVPPADPTLVAEVIGPVEPVDQRRPGSVVAQDLEGVADTAARLGAEQGRLGPVPSGPDGPGQRTDAAGGADDARRLDAEPVRSIEDDNVQPSTADELIEAMASPPGAAFGAGGLLVAAGLLGLLHRARRLRLSQAEEGSIPAPPPLELVDIETVLRNRADARRALSVHAAIRSLTDRPLVPGEPLVAPEVVRMAGDRIEVVQQGPDPDLPSPWRATERTDDRAGTTHMAVLTAERFPEPPEDEHQLEVAAPTMVTVGGGLLVNLETVGVLAVEGPVEMTAGLVRSMVHELATGPARRTIDIRLSDWLPGAELHDHVVCGPLDGLADELMPWLEDVELALTASGAYSAYALRAAGHAGSLPGPTIVFADAADAERLAPIIDLARRHTLPLAVVLAGEPGSGGPAGEAAVTVRLDGDVLRLEPYGFTAAMQYLDVDLVLGTAALISHAGQATMVPRHDDQDTILPAGDPAADHATDPAQVPTEETPERDVMTELPIEEHEITDQAEHDDTGILIRVLGPVELEGAPAGLTADEQSILAFLAVVGPSTEDQIRDAVFPGRDLPADRWQELVAGLRRRLGPRFPEPGDGRYRVRSVVTDLGSARRWITKARGMAGERAANLLQLALTDVRGEPFQGVDQRSWQWIHDHKMALATQATTLLIDACFDLCDLAFAAGDLHLARWACDVGATIDPLHETIVIRRVQLLSALGLDAEAAEVVDAWEATYRREVGRPAPLGARAALPRRPSADGVDPALARPETRQAPQPSQAPESPEVLTPHAG